MKRTFLTIILIVCVFSGIAYGQNTSPIDLILVLDTSSGMSSSYENVSGYLTGAFLTEFLRVGDTFHLITFAERPRLDTARRISGVGDVETMIGRMLIQYPVEAGNNVASALSFAEQYITTLPNRAKKIVLVTLGEPNANNLVSAAKQRVSSSNTTIDMVQVTPGQRLTNLPGSDRPAARTASAVTAQSTAIPPARTTPTQPATPSAAQTQPAAAPSTTQSTAPSTAQTQPARTPSTTQSTTPSTAQTQPATPSATQSTTPSTTQTQTTTQSAAPPTTPTQPATPSATQSTTTPSTTQTQTTTQSGAPPVAATPSTTQPVTTPPTSAPSETEALAASAGALAAVSAVTQEVLSEETDEITETAASEVKQTTAAAPKPAQEKREQSSSFTSSLPFIIGIIILILLILGLIIFLLSRKLSSSPNRVITGSKKDNKNKTAAFTATQQQRSSPYDTSLKPFNGKTPVINPDAPALLNLYVNDQNTSIGKRNIHSLKSGFSLSVGGSKSDDFYIFLVPVPAKLGEIRRDGSRLTFVPHKPKYFPDIGSNEIKDCINKTIRIVSDKNYEMRFRFELYEDPLLELNRLLHSVKLPG